MRDLYRSLDTYPQQFLQAIAEVWRIELPKAEPREMVAVLAPAMLTSEVLPELLSALSLTARQALAEMLQEEGIVPGHRLAARYGSIRRLGPSRIEREKPWLQPANAVEELYYHGLIYRTYGSIGEHTGEVFFIPDDLAERLGPLLASAPRVEAQRLDAVPSLVKSDGRALVEDLFALLTHIRRSPPPATWGHSQSGDMVQPVPDTLGLDERLQGETSPERMAFLRRLLLRLRLVQENQGLLRPTMRAREWLRLNDLHRVWSHFSVWLDDRRWNELTFLTSLNLEESRLQGDSSPTRARRALVEVLGQCPAEVWLSLDSFIQMVKHYHPDYLRAQGDYDSWQIRDARTGDLLAGFGSWEQVEGALARHVSIGPLRWLGAVDVGYEMTEGSAVALKVTAQGHRLIAAREARLEPEEVTIPTQLAVVDEDFRVHILLANTLYERYQLERFADWEGQDEHEARYHVTVESLWKSHNTGVKIEQVLSFLTRITNDQVPQMVMRSLHAWGGRFGRVMMRHAVLLETIDEQTMHQLRTRPEIRTLLGQPLSTTLCLVEEEQIEELTARLKELGIWPHIRI